MVDSQVERKDSFLLPTSQPTQLHFGESSSLLMQICFYFAFDNFWMNLLTFKLALYSRVWYIMNEISREGSIAMPSVLRVWFEG